MDAVVPILLLPDPQRARSSEEDAGLAGFAPVLRLLRLARLLKIFKTFSQLQVILRGLGRGIQSVGYVVLMLTLVLYIYAVSPSAEATLPEGP